jgi:diguanylate cyclase (GGDEF)-like protein
MVTNAAASDQFAARVSEPAVDTADFTRPEDEAGRFDHAYLGRLLIMRWGLAIVYITFVLIGILPVREVPFVLSFLWYCASNGLATWTWLQRRPVSWHDRLYIYFDLVTVVAVMVAVADMAYPIWLCLVLLMLAASAEQTSKVAQRFNAACVLSFLATTAYLHLTGWDDVDVGPTAVATAVLAFIAYDVSVTFEGNRRLRRYIREMAVTDPLTQIANRRSLSKLLATPPRPGSSLAVAIMDVDRFKQYNDTHGHLAGDKLLVKIAERLTESFPGATMISRYGGDEFVVVLEATRVSEVTDVVNSALNGKRYEPGSVSVGVSMWPAEQPTLDAALAAADDRLRAAKRSRRSGRSGRMMHSRI